MYVLASAAVLCVVLFYVTRFFWYLYVTSTSDKRCRLPLPPGGLGLPFVGEMIELALAVPRGRDFFTDRRLKYGNIYKTHVMGRPTVRVVGAAHIRRVLQADMTSADLIVPTTVGRLLGARALAMSIGHAHRAQRKVVLKAFGTKALTGYAIVLNRVITEETADWLGRHSAYDLMEHLATRAAWEVLVGLRHFKQVEQTVVKDFEVFLNGFWTLPVSLPGTSFHKAEAANRRLTSLIVTEYRKRLEDDFETLDFHDALSLVLEAGQEQGSPLVEEDVTDIIREMLFAGHSTTSSAATSIVMYLAQNKGVLKKIRQELADHDLLEEDVELSYDKVAALPYLGDVISETLRLAPPVGGGFRKALKTLEIGGYQVPKGWAIIWSAFETHEVSPLFEQDRSAFRPERWSALRTNPDLPYNHVPFGSGQRACVGKTYAKLLLRILTAQLARKYDWELENNDVTMLRFPVRHPKDRLPVIFKTRQSTTRVGNEEEAGLLLTNGVKNGCFTNNNETAKNRNVEGNMHQSI